MDRNSNVLRKLFIFFIIIILSSCFEKNKQNEDEYVDDLPNNYPIEINEAKGTYIYIPQKNEYTDDFKFLKLKKGDTLKLVIKPDSTYSFNVFYYNNGIKSLKYSGKFENYENLLVFDKYPDKSNYVFGTSGFKKGKDIYFYNRLKVDSSGEYNYTLYYKKISNNY
ncbi:hypothetical protein [Empedobacter brevis]|uniref:hypothetical protein n=1 Tax=Empedobacter brevis TaxID=247 RepID=UPI0028AEEB76|nr:hypothetical protein [Empedobacter brevis]